MSLCRDAFITRRLFDGGCCFAGSCDVFTGSENLVLTNAAGGISEKVEAGDLMMLTDQISSFVPSPLIGKT